MGLKLEDIFTCDPFSIRGREALSRIDNQNKITPDVFFKEIYADPYFCKSITNNELEDTTDSDESIVDFMDDYAFSTEGTDRRVMLEHKKDFEQRFLSDVTNSILLIRGASGCGKSTYLNCIKQTRCGRTIDFEIESSESTVTRGSLQFPANGETLPSKNGTTPSPPWLLLIDLLGKTFDIMWEIVKLNDSSIFDLMQINFKRIYGSDYIDEIGDMFSLFKKNSCCDGKLDNPQQNNYRNAKTELFQALLKLCVPVRDNATTCIMNTLRVLTRVLLCYSDIENPEQTLISFDGMEHYIDIGKRIYDKDIRNIADAIFIFTQDEEKYYQKRGLSFAKFFKVVMVIRDTTDKMLSGDVHTHFTQQYSNSINITNWYLVEDSYEKRMSYFKQHISPDSISVKFFNLIISDRNYDNSIMKLVSSMYNYNKRRITRILARVADVFEELQREPEKNSKVLTVDRFLSYWQDKKKYISRYLLRRSVLRLIWSSINDTHFFESIHDHPGVEHLEDVNTYARRILIWLSRHTAFKQDQYASFYNLIKGVLEYPDIPNRDEPSKQKIENLAKTLIALDEFRYEAPDYDQQDLVPFEPKPNRWCQLAVIKFNRELHDIHLDSATLSEKMLSEYKVGSLDSNEFGVKITLAGCFFTYMQVDFEYFACRYDDTKLPLVLMQDFDRITKTLKCVYANAKLYIEQVLLNEHSLCNGNFMSLYGRGLLYQHVTKGGNIEEASYPYRVIKNHRDYLLHYKRFIDYAEEVGDPHIRDGKTTSLLEVLNDHIKKYEKIFNDLNGSGYTINTKNGFIVIQKYFRPGTKL